MIVASGSNDRTVRIWDTATGTARGTLKGHSSSVNAVAFSPDGQLLASCSNDRRLHGQALGRKNGSDKQTARGPFELD